MVCLNCQKEINRGKYCNNKCQAEYQVSLKLKEWLNGKNAVREGGNSIPKWMRSYLIEESNHRCSKCGWSEINEYTKTIPLEIDHIDGDAYNNIKENLRVLCPNCHSLTKTFKNTGNRTSSRSYRRVNKNNGF